MYVNKILLIPIFLFSVLYGQTFNNTVTIQKDLRVQQETILGGVSKPLAGDMFIFYDTIYAPNIFGTGTILTLDGSGYIKKSTAAAAGAGTVTSVATTNPITGGTITTTGTIGIGGLTTFGTAGQLIRTNGGATGWEYFTPAYGTGTVTSIATTSPIGGGTITTTGTLKLLASAGDKMIYSTGVDTWAEISALNFGRGFLGLIDLSAALLYLSIPVDNTKIPFGDGTQLINDANLTFDPATQILGIHRIEFNGGDGRISKYENIAATNGQLFIGETAAGQWKTGAITSTDLTIGYSTPNITLDYAAGSIENADINSSAAIDATKIADGTVTSTEFQYINTLTSNAQTQINTKAPTASPTFTGTVTIPTPFTLGATSVTSTGTQFNYLNAATGTTGTTSTNLVFSTSPTLVTPTLGTFAATNGTFSGTVTNYNGIATVSNGIPAEVATVSLTGQTASIAATTAYTTTAADATFLITWIATVTTAATSSSVLGGFQVKYTNASDNVVKTYPTTDLNFFNRTNANTTGAAIGGTFVVKAKASTAIQYIMGYTSVGGTSMAYDLNITVVRL